MFEFKIHKTIGNRRIGQITTAHGVIDTPAFMPVGTAATVKAMLPQSVASTGAQIILGNTYHLMLRPTAERIAKLGGLHKFMGWNGPILTDSGGFQVMSLSKLRKITENGVTFQSHVDGSKHEVTPERSIEIQHLLGSTITMAFDECTPDTVPEEYARQAMERTHRWAQRSLDEHKRLASSVILNPRKEINSVKNPLNTKREGSFADTQDDKQKNYRQFLFGIIQGSVYKNLREESAKYISSLDFDGIAIGGESVGYNMQATAEILDWVYPLIAEDKPHYAMGLGLSPTDLLVAIEHGVDMFDCVGPTRLARHGMLFCYAPDKKHRLNITNSQFTKDTGPIDPDCQCHTCQNYSRAYLHHLFAAQEMSGMRLASIHNLHFMLDLTRCAREAILEDRFDELLKKWN